MNNYLQMFLKRIIAFNTRNYATKSPELDSIRNLGILAHIDAGKTTTTERMLYYSGLINHMGEVHHGNTVTDYMEQERERGITITSASVTFPWRKHRFNLIDTPGHIDFTMEVEQTLNVLDGAVVILDSSAGVEAQTSTVWRQADRYELPRIIFLNKMDRTDASVEMCMESIRKKLGVTPVCLQIPLKENNKLIGLIDVLTMEKLVFASGKYERTLLNPKGEEWNSAFNSRGKVADKLSEYNSNLADQIIAKNSIDNIETGDLIAAIREETHKRTIVPVVMGSAYKNIGIQTLMDSVLLYLPSPSSKREIYRHFNEDLCAKSFKITHDKQRGNILVFLRIYNGTITKNQRLHSVTQNKNETVQKIYTAFADDLREVENVSNGNIAVVTGLKHVKMGDLVTTSSNSLEKARQRYVKTTKQEPIPGLFGTNVKIPEPVFFCSIEPESISYQTLLENALIELQREDPSFTVTQNHETGQTVLGGMGELHIEIIKDRLLRNYKVKADLGPLQINYHEALTGSKKETFEYHTKIGNTDQAFSITLSVSVHNEDYIFTLDKTTESAKNLAGIYQKHLNAIRNGAEAALLHGPKLSCKVSNVQVMLHNFTASRGTSETIITAGTTQFLTKMIQEIGTEILEPVMRVEIVTPSEYLSGILSDLSRRRGMIQDITLRGTMKVALTETPLSELMGYSTILRTISSGTASFSMEFHEFKRMSQLDELNAIKSVRGF